MPVSQMFAPDGTLGDVPYDKVHDAIAAGGKMAYKMIAPDGTPGYVPADKMLDAQKAGGHVVPNETSDADGGKPGFWSQYAQQFKDMASSMGQSLHATNQRLAAPGNHESPLESPASSLAADIAARSSEGRSPVYNAASTAAEAIGIPTRPMETAANAGNTKGVLAAAAAPATLAVAPLAAEGIVRGTGALLPSTVRAGQALSQVKSVAGDVPIDMGKVGDSALDLYTQSQRGATLPKVVRDFVNRATKPGSDPITYAEAKDFQSNVSRISANERMNLNPNTQRLLGQLNSDLKDSLASAADTVGKGQQFKQAMQEYHNAMTLRGFTDNAKELAWKSLLGGLGVYGTKKLWDLIP